MAENTDHAVLASTARFRHLGSLRQPHTVTLLALAAPLVWLTWAAWGRRWMSDDGYIYLRVVKQVLAGNGPVFNHGERMETATSPLWVGVLVLTKSLLRPVPLPWLAVLLGLLLSLTGLALAQWGAYRLWQRGRRRVMLPLGSVIIVALPPFWDFATSGLETGLAFAWLGACFWGLVRLYGSSREEHGAEPRAVTAQGRVPKWLLVLIGLGPLVRPDFVIFSLAFMILFFVSQPRFSWRDRLQAGAFALALPCAYELFRMGYYGALTPSPAFAKEASAANWPQGWRYLLDTMKPYWLPLPLLLVSGLALPSWLTARRAAGQPDRTKMLAFVVTPPLAALLHASYVVYIGGDFMHARLLLPDLFAMLLPVAVIGADTFAGLLLTLAVAIWAVVCASTLRVPYSAIGPDGIADERAVYVTATRNPHPITPDDYRRFAVADFALSLRKQLPRGNLLLQRGGQIALRPGVPADAVVQEIQVGIFGYILGVDVHVLDVRGLADPIAGRLELSSRRGRPGHEKLLPEAWVVARFAGPVTRLPVGGQTLADTSAANQLPFAAGSLSLVDVSAADAALSCDGAKQLIAAVNDPMTPGRFVSNLFEAFRLYRWRIPADPKQARADVCGAGASNPEQVQAQIDAGLRQLAAGNADAAAATFRAVLAVDPRNEFAYYNLGVIDQLANMMDTAENNYRVALLIDPNFESALYNLAIVRTAAGYPADAIALYRRVIAVNASNAAAHLNLGLLLRDQGSPDEGLAEIRTAVALNPQYASRLTPVPAALPNSQAAPPGIQTATP